MPDELLTPSEVAAELGVTPRTVQRWIAQGRLPAIRVGGRDRVSRSSLATVAGNAAVAGDAPATAAAARPIRSLLIANRGEIVGRVACTARRLGIRTIGLQVAGDWQPDGVDEIHPIEGYLDGDAILAIARSTGADAIHPGYGFLSENAAFSSAVASAGLIWVGPPPRAIEAMGDKAAARRQAQALGVPTLPGYDGDDQSDEILIGEAQRIGFPLLVKPSAGGGGKGMRVVRDGAELQDALVSARREASRAFADDRLILERFLEGPRHVEVQVLFDAHGHGVHLGERDCSAQRRNQKIVEEAPAPSVSAALRERMGAAALALAGAVGYVGAGTVEFLLADDGSFFFLEMNTRLQVEHPVTEAVTGRDLVADQLRVAQGLPLDVNQDSVALHGHAIEARLYAEDPEHGFLPATGRVLRLRWPAGEGLRVDAGVHEGDAVTDRFDPMLAKVIARGSTRREAHARLRTALDETEVLGVRTNLRFLRWLLAQPVAERGGIRTDSIAGLAVPGAPDIPDEAWRAAGRALLGAGPYAVEPWGGGWRANTPAAVRLEADGETRRVELGEPEHDAPQPVVSGGTAFLSVEGQTVEVRLAMPPSIEEATRHAASAEGHATLVAPMPGRVIAVRATEGETVAEHASIVVIEAMKMEHAVTTPLAGRLERLLVREGQQVERGEVLAEVSA
jgi:excisionase family DNA binding protein